MAGRFRRVSVFLLEILQSHYRRAGAIAQRRFIFRYIGLEPRLLHADRAITIPCMGSAAKPLTKLYSNKCEYWQSRSVDIREEYKISELYAL
jgi:hypothetical protein